MSRGITRDRAENAIESPLEQEDSGKQSLLLAADYTAVEIAGRRSFYRLRQKWSWAIIAWLSILILFNCCLAIAIGADRLDFTRYQWFITAVTVETFLQVIGLGLIAVKYLFSDGSHTERGTRDESRIRKATGRRTDRPHRTADQFDL